MFTWWHREFYKYTIHIKTWLEFTKTCQSHSTLGRFSSLKFNLFGIVIINELGVKCF